MYGRICACLMVIGAAACTSKVEGELETPASYAWVTGDFDQCDAPGLCGSGSRSRVVKCVSDRGITVDDGACTGPRPASDEACSATSGCLWQADPIGDCTAPNSCSAGIETRLVTCRNIFGTEVDPTWCSGPAPAVSGGCVRTSACAWEIGSFTTPDLQGCGEGVRTRPVTCVDAAHTVVSSSWCPSPAPASSEPYHDYASCTLVASEWSACSSACGYGTHTRTVACESPSGASVDRSWCTAASPPTSEACAGTTNCCPPAVLDASPFAGGDGSSASPYIICTAAQLDHTRSALSSNYLLGRDLDLASVGFVPLGDESHPFRGLFDGASHSLSNWTYAAPTTTSLGLFRTGSSATVRHLRLENIDLEGQDAVGGLFGNAGSSTVNDVTVTGHVRGRNSVGGAIGLMSSATVTGVHTNATVAGAQYVGGIVGSTSYANVVACDTAGAVSGTLYVGGIAGIIATQANVVAASSSANVQGQQYVGGVVGDNGGNAIIKSSSSGTVTGTSNVGGITGINETGVYDAWSTGAVSATNTVGGLVGNNAGLVARSFSTSAVTGTTNVGGLVGTGTGLVRRGFWDVQSSTQATSAGGVGLTSAAMRSPATYAEWDNYTVWQTVDGQLPAFRTAPRACVVGAAAFSGGLGTMAEPFVIDRAAQLYDINCNLSASYVLGASIDFTGIASTPSIGILPPVTAVDDPLTPSQFRGTFDGAGFTISHWSNYGFFGALFAVAQSATIKNLVMLDTEVGGATSVGTLLSLGSATISDVHVQGVIFGAYVVGGLAANFSGNVTRSSTNLDTVGRGYTGGFFGFCNTATVSNSYATGSLEARGGGAGFGGGGNSNNGCTVTNSYAAVALSGSSYAGFAVGVSSTGSFWDTNVSGATPITGTGTGKTTSEMHTQGTFVGWDFDTTWQIEPEAYPTLR